MGDTWEKIIWQLFLKMINKSLGFNKKKIKSTKTDVVLYFNHSDGCGIQCVSYISKKNPNEIRKICSTNFINNFEIISLLKKFGFKAKQLFRCTICSNRKYIVIVPSLNNVGEFHYVVVWCNQNKNGTARKVQVFDPVTNPAKKRYVSQTKNKLSENEVKICSWTSVIEVFL